MEQEWDADFDDLKKCWFCDLPAGGYFPLVCACGLATGIILDEFGGYSCREFAILCQLEGKL